jgi:hypothetical protein
VIGVFFVFSRPINVKICEIWFVSTYTYRSFVVDSERLIINLKGRFSTYVYD